MSEEKRAAPSLQQQVIVAYLESASARELAAIKFKVDEMECKRILKETEERRRMADAFKQEWFALADQQTDKNLLAVGKLRASFDSVQQPLWISIPGPVDYNKQNPCTRPECKGGDRTSDLHACALDPVAYRVCDRCFAALDEWKQELVHRLAVMRASPFNQGKASRAEKRARIE